MKLLRPLIVAALVAGGLFAGSALLQAQNATNPPPARARGIRSGPTIDQIATTLKLDDATKAKVKTILDAQQQRMRDLRSDTTLSQQDRRTKVQAIRDDATTQMKAVLTTDQFDQYRKMTQRQRRAAQPATPAATPPQ